MSETYTKLRYHVLLSTREQLPLITPEVGNRLCRYIGGIARHLPVTLLAIGGMPDHVHLLLGLRPNQSLADIVRPIKTNASKEIGRSETRFRWQPGYLAFGISESKIAPVRRYIRSQARHHGAMSLQDEATRLLARHGLESSPRGAAPTRFRLPVHLVFGTKNRLPLILPEIEARLHRRIAGIAKNECAELLEIGGIADHLHLLLDIRPRHSVAGLVKAIKGATSRWLNSRFPPFAWQRGYGGFSVSQSHVPVLQRYIQRQPEHHRTMSFADEYRILLQRHGFTDPPMPATYHRPSP